MTDLRKEFNGIKTGLVFIWISFLFNPVIHGVNIGLLASAAGCLIIGINVKQLFEIDNKFSKIFALSIIIFCISIIANCVLFTLNADPNELMQNFTEGSSETFPLASYNVQYLYAGLFPVIYGLIALMMIFLLSVIAKVCQASGAYRAEEIYVFRKKFIRTSIIYVILVLLSQLLYVTTMNSYNLIASGSISIEESIVMEAPYGLVSILYLVFDIIFFVRIIKIERYARLMSECALFDPKLYESNAIDATFKEKEDNSRYDSYQ